MDLGPLTAFGIVLVRIGMLVAMTPLLGGTWAPMPVKVGLTVILAIVIMPLITLPAMGNMATIALVVAHESLIGLALAMSVRIVLGAAELGGYLIGFQMGFAYAAIVDPQSGVRNNVLAALYASLATLALLGTNLHHQLLRLLVATYETLPVAAAAAMQPSVVETVMRMLGLIFVTGARLAAPVVLVLLFVELVMGVTSRAAPSLNLMMVAAPLRLILGLAALGLAIRVVPPLVTRVGSWGLELGAQLAHALR
jgi:flagellar biosynthetic protein FliR